MNQNRNAKQPSNSLVHFTLIPHIPSPAEKPARAALPYRFRIYHTEGLQLRYGSNVFALLP